MFEDLYDYMKSLERILSFNPFIVYPAHGPIVSDPQKHVKEYITHRNAREAQVLKALEDLKERELTAMEIVKIVYHVSLKNKVAIVYEFILY